MKVSASLTLTHTPRASETPSPAEITFQGKTTTQNPKGTP